MRTWSIHRQDDNDDELCDAARKLGCVMVKHGPLEYWVWWRGLSTHWMPIEIKDPKRKGHRNEFTDAQVRFMQTCQELGARFEVWRTLEDVEESRSWAFVRARA